MHDCPECDQACGCDGEDHYQPAPPDCQHGCEEDYVDDGDDFPEPLPVDQNDDYDEGGEG